MTQTYGASRLSFVTRTYFTNVWSTEICMFLFDPSSSSTTTMASRYPTHSLLRFLLVSNSLDLILSILLELWNAVVGKIIGIYRCTCLTCCLAAQDSYLHTLSKKFYLPSPPMRRRQKREHITGLLRLSLPTFPLPKLTFLKTGIPEGVTNALEVNFFALYIISH